MPVKTKKAIDRAKREQRLRRALYIGTLTVALAIVAVIAFGLFQIYYLAPRQPVAKIGKDSISVMAFQARVRYERDQLVQKYLGYLEMMRSFSTSDNAGLAQMFQQDLNAIKTQLEPTTMGQQVLEEMIQEILIRQEAERRGITVTDEEVEEAIQKEFNYLPGGPEPTATEFPTARPTSTLSLTQIALAPEATEATATALPTSTPDLTATPTAVLSPTATFTALPTPTAVTLESFQKSYQEVVKLIKERSGFGEQDLKELVRNRLYAQKLMDVITADLPIEQEQVWARHILVKDEATAREVIAKLKESGDWKTLAAEYSLDTGSKDRSGGLGWFSRGEMVKPFEDVAFSLAVGEISEPVQTDYGWHVIQVLGHEVRPLSEAQYADLKQKTFSTWLENARQSADVKIFDNWVEFVPTEPALPEGV